MQFALCFLLAGGAAAASGEVTDTLPLQRGEIVFFLGISGDFTEGKDQEMQAALSGALGLDILGNPVRSLTSRDRLVWAVRAGEGDDPAKMIRKLIRPLKKNGYKPTRVHATVLTPTGRALSASLRTAARKIERDNPKVWGTFLSSKNRVLWVFHDSKLKGKKVLEGVREAKVKVSFHHQELELQHSTNREEASESAATEAASLAKTELDLVGSQIRDGRLILDVYLRDLDHLLLLAKGRKIILCPDVTPGFFAEGEAGNAAWVVTLDAEGYPFQG